MADDDHRQDDELIVKAYHGDQHAFGVLYERYLNRVFRYIYFRVADSIEAEDLTETVFIKAWEALGSVRIEEFNFKAWVYRIAHNVVIDRYRTNRADVPLDDIGHLHDVTHNPEYAYRIQEESSQLAKEISKLDPVMQDVIIYRFILGLSHAETAEIMEKSEVNIRVIQYRALQKLKEKLDWEP